MVENIIGCIQNTAATLFSVAIVKLLEKVCEKCKEEHEETIVEEQAPTLQESDSEPTLWEPAQGVALCGARSPAREPKEEK